MSEELEGLLFSPQASKCRDRQPNGQRGRETETDLKFITRWIIVQVGEERKEREEWGWQTDRIPELVAGRLFCTGGWVSGMVWQTHRYGSRWPDLFAHHHVHGAPSHHHLLHMQ